MLTPKQWRILLRIVFALSTLFIIFVSAYPNLNDNDHEFGSGFLIRLDYLFHFLVFFFWGLALRFAVPVKWVKTIWHLLGVIIAAMLFVVFSEFYQKYVPGRAYNPYDLLANFLGLFLALGIHRLFPATWNRLFRFLTAKP